MLLNGGLDTTNALKQAAEFKIAQGGQVVSVFGMTINNVAGIGPDVAQGSDVRRPAVLGRGFAGTARAAAGSGNSERLRRGHRMRPPAARAGARGARGAESVSRAFVAYAASGRHAQVILKLFEAGAAAPGVTGDLGVGDAVAQADDHGLVPAARDASRVMMPDCNANYSH